MRDRDIYRRIALLNTDGSQKILSKEMQSIESSIKHAESNDEIYRQLELLERFAFTESKDALRLLTFVINKVNLPQKTYQTEYGPYDGKEKTDIVLKALEVLDGIRYYQTKPIVRIYRDLFKQPPYRKKVEDYIRNIAEYNYEATKRIGYYAQKQVLETLHKRDIVKNDDLEFYLKAIQYIASTEATYHRMKDEKTLVWGSAPVVYNKQLDEIRTEAINNLMKLFDEVETIKDKETIINSLQSFINYHHTGEPSKELLSLIERNRMTIFEFYKRTVIDGLKNKAMYFPIYLQMEEDFGILQINDQTDKVNTAIKSIQKALDSSREYQLYKAFAGDRFLLRTKGREATYEEVKKDADEFRSSLFNEINEKSLSKFAPDFNLIADYEGIEERWRLNEFYGFMGQLAEKKPALAFSLLTDTAYPAFKKILGSFIVGFARGNHADKLYATIDIACDEKSVDAIASITFAFTLMAPSKRFVNVLSSIINKSAPFNYLKHRDEVYYIDNLATAAIHYFSESKNSELFERVLRIYADRGSRLISAFDMALYRDKELPKLPEDCVTMMWDILVKEDRFDYHCEKVLLYLTHGDLRLIVKFFDARIKQYMAIKKEDRKAFYDAVPYHLDGVFQENVFENNADYSEVFNEVMASFKTKWTYRDAEIANLIKGLGNYKKALLDYIKNSDDKAAPEKALTFCSGIDSTDLEIVMAIVARTADKERWSSAYSLVYNTGVVSGEYGLANAHKFKKEQIEKNYLNSKNKNIREFSKMAINYLDASIKAEIQRTDESNRLMKLEFQDDEE